MPAKKPMAEWKHGTHGTYVNGCRCDDCRVAANAYKRRLYHANLAKAREYCRDKARRRAGRRSIGDLDATLIRRDAEYRRLAETSDGELGELIAAQSREDVYWIRPDLRHARPFDETRWGGYGERDPDEAWRTTDD